MDQPQAFAHRPSEQHLDCFDGFPYLLTRVAPAIYVISLLPGDWSVERLSDLALRQARANRLDTCLALGPNLAEYFNRNGSIEKSTIAPRGGILIRGPLRLAEEFSNSEDLRHRGKWLKKYLAPQQPGYVLGDLTKGGRRATDEELRTLKRRLVTSIPPSLERCETCSKLRGECLDRNPLFEGQVMTVACRCQNENRCARCGELLFERAVWANFYDEATGDIIHVPGFVGLRHRCAN